MKAMLEDTRIHNAGAIPAGERKTVHILNPVSGGSRYFEAARRAVESVGGEILVSEGPGQIFTLTRDLFRKNPFAHAVVYGGDGTVYEAVNGIMESGAAETASFSVYPAGSGNDFSAYANDSGVFPKKEIRRIDLVKTTVGDKVRYFANIMNMGFDCSVVLETFRVRKTRIIRGASAYIAGLAATLIKKPTISATVTLSGCEGGEDRTFQQKFLLTACANAHYYGGGFHAAPLASLTDGLMDVMVINDMSRLRFLSLVGAYKAGTYIDENGVLGKKYKDVISYHRCRKIRIEGVSHYCLDGEVFKTGGSPIEAEVIPNAIGFAAI